MVLFLGGGEAGEGGHGSGGGRSLALQECEDPRAKVGSKRHGAQFREFGLQGGWHFRAESGIDDVPVIEDFPIEFTIIELLRVPITLVMTAASS